MGAEIEMNVGGEKAGNGIEDGEARLDMMERDPEEINSHLKVWP